MCDKHDIKFSATNDFIKKIIFSNFKFDLKVTPFYGEE